MSRTPRAVLVAGLVVLVSVAGVGTFLGFDAGASLLAGAVAGLLAGALILLAARRAETFHDPTDPTGPTGPTDPTGSDEGPGPAGPA